MSCSQTDHFHQECEKMPQRLWALALAVLQRLSEEYTLFLSLTEQPPMHAVQASDPLDKYCDDNPEADECRVYED